MATRIDKERFGPWAIVTGASSGIGKEFARQLAASGLHLVLVARRLSLLDELGHELTKEFGVQYRAVGVDLTDEKFLEKLEEATHDLDVGLLISNAGIGIPGKFLSIEHDTLLQVVQLNVTAHLTLTHHYGQQMAKRGHGGIILVSAMGAAQGIPYMANDSATKSYVLTLGETLNVEFKQHGVHVTVLQPGPTETPVLDKLGFDAASMPLKPMTVEQCVSEGLAALNANRPSHVTGAIYRMMNSLLPRSLFRAMNGRMLEKAVEEKQPLYPIKEING